jgi:hypothetical protein
MSLDHLKKLFKQFIDELKKEVEDPERLKKWIDEDFDGDVDGRQIRTFQNSLLGLWLMLISLMAVGNIVSSARSLAKSKDNYDGKLKLSHIKRVLKMTVSFQNHLRDQRVAAERDRVNDY